jgi:adenylate cyclase
MFASSEVPALIATLQKLVECIAAEGERFPDVRVGVAYGPATTRGGDWFGAPVNVASRVTEIARPGRILATEEVRELAPDEAWHRRRRRASLKGVEGRLRLFSLDAEHGG